MKYVAIVALTAQLMTCFSRVEFCGRHDCGAYIGVDRPSYVPRECFIKAVGFVPDIDWTQIYNWQQIPDTKRDIADQYLTKIWKRYCNDCWKAEKEGGL